MFNGDYTHWKGKAFEVYTKEELIDIVKQTCRYYEFILKTKNHQSDVLWDIIRFKRVGPIARFFGWRR